DSSQLADHLCPIHEQELQRKAIRASPFQPAGGQCLSIRYKVPANCMPADLRCAQDLFQAGDPAQLLRCFLYGDNHFFCCHSSLLKGPSTPLLRVDRRKIKKPPLGWPTRRWLISLLCSLGSYWAWQ